MAYAALPPSSYPTHSPYSSTSSHSFNVPSPIDAAFDAAADHHRQAVEHAYHSPSAPSMSDSYHQQQHSHPQLQQQQQQDIGQEFDYVQPTSSIYPTWSHPDKRQPYFDLQQQQQQQQHQQHSRPLPASSQPVLSVYIPSTHPQQQQGSPAVIHSPAPLPAQRQPHVLQTDLPDWTGDSLGFTSSRPKHHTSTFYTATGHYQLPHQHHYQSSSSSLVPPQPSEGPMPIFNLSSHVNTYYSPPYHETTHSPPPMRPTELSPMTIDAARFIRPSEVSPSTLSPLDVSSSGHSRSGSGDSRSQFDDAYDACYNNGSRGFQPEAFDLTHEPAEYEEGIARRSTESTTSSVTSDSDIDADFDEDDESGSPSMDMSVSPTVVSEAMSQDDDDDEEEEEDHEYEDKTDGEFVVRGARRGSAASSSSSVRQTRRRMELDPRYNPYDYHSPTTEESTVRTRRSSSNTASSSTSISYSPSTTTPSSEKPRPKPQNILPTPIPVPNLTKKSRGRRVPTASSQDLRKAAVVHDPYVGASSRNRGSKGSRSHMCKVPGCGKCFARGEHLKRHVRSIHTHEKPHKCPYPGCEKDFSRYDNLGQHMRVHKDWSP